MSRNILSHGSGASRIYEFHHIRGASSKRIGGRQGEYLPNAGIKDQDRGRLEQHLPQVCPMLIPRAASDRLHAERLHPATTPVGVPGRSEELGDLGRHLAPGLGQHERRNALAPAGHGPPDRALAGATSRHRARVIGRVLFEPSSNGTPARIRASSLFARFDPLGA